MGRRRFRWWRVALLTVINSSLLFLLQFGVIVLSELPSEDNNSLPIASQTHQSPGDSELNPVATAPLSDRRETIESSMTRLVSVDFEVFGRVQGVFFRKHTQAAAKRLGVVGWCRNTRQDTVQGQAQGEFTAVAEMKRWLQMVGSPQSKIEKTEFSNEKTVQQLSFSTFAIKR